MINLDFLLVVSVIISNVYTQSFPNDLNQLRKIVERVSYLLVSLRFML